MRFYHPTQTTYSTFEAPEDKSPLELRPSLEKGEETHVRDCLVWHSPSPRYTYRNHGYHMYTHKGRDYWTSPDCGNPGCRTCVGSDHLINRDVGYVRRNELGRTIDRGFSSKPRKLRLQEGEFDGGWNQHHDPDPTSSDTARGLRDPFNRPVNGYQPWHGSGRNGDCSDRDGRWNDCKTARGCSCNGRGSFGCKDFGGACHGRRSFGCKNYGGKDCRGKECYASPKSGDCPGCNGHGCPGCQSSRLPLSYQGPTVGSTDPYDLPTYRQTFPRIDEKDPGSVSYRAPAVDGYAPGAEDLTGMQNTMGSGGQTYRPPVMDYRPSEPDLSTSNGTRPIGGGGGAAGGASARGNDAIFPRKDDPKSSMKPIGPRRELKGPNTAVAFTV